MKSGLLLIVGCGFALLIGALLAFDVAQRMKKRRRRHKRRARMFDDLL